jgi:hypothetical protein
MQIAFQASTRLGLGFGLGLGLGLGFFEIYVIILNLSYILFINIVNVIY